ncbi:MAG: DEAD/DEAH box helicase family protein, partial [Gammaproteobacteria bacterium]|nr:DEAD/DEAH box helicase family protein [Gammaproteobacteria bacterium]
MLDDELKHRIQRAYRSFLEGKGVHARYSQRQMIADIAKTLAGIASDDDGARTGGKHVCVIEAGTGTGKTVAYALAAIPVAQALEKTLVISTATVALQEQLIYRDLPDILHHSGLEFTFALAKGRGRYLCSHKLDNHISGQQSGVTLSLWEDEQAQQDEMTLQLYRELHSAYSKSEWDGDRDNW